MDGPVDTATVATRAGGAAGPSFILVGAALWGLLGIFGTYAQRAGLDPYDVAWWRAFSGCLLFGLHARVAGASFPRGRDLAVTALFGLTAGAVFYGAYQVAVGAGGASLASVLLYTAPAFVAVMGGVFLHERIGLREIAAVLTSIVGIALVALGGGSGVTVSALSLGAGLLSGLTYSLYYLYGRVYYSRYHPAACLSVALFVALIALTPLTSPALLSSQALGTAWPALLGVGVLSTYLAYLAHSAGVRRIEATRASVIATVEPVVAAVLASLLFAERPGVVAVVGGVLVLAAAVALAVSPTRAGD